MQTIKGKYNQANVMIDTLDETTRSQVQGFVNNPSFHGSYIAIMPDCHAGAGSCIGFTMQMNDRIIPDVVGVDIGCLDKDTEYLTPVGWKSISEYVEGDKVLQYDKETDTASFVTPSRYVVKDCKEFFWFKNSKGLDQMVSEEHKMLVWSGYKSRGYTLKDYSPIELTQMSLKRGYFGVKTAFTISQKGIDFSNTELRLLIAISADGCIRGNCIGGKRVEFHLKKSRKIDRLSSILQQLKYKYSITLNSDGTQNVNFICPEKMTKNLSVLWKANYEQLCIVVEECLLWDGHKGYRSFYSSTIKENADVIQFAFAATGTRAGIYANESEQENWSVCYNVIPTKNNVVGITEYTKQPSVDGKKYCFTVPSGYFVIRRKDKISITGNCGMLSRKFDVEAFDIPAFDAFIKENIPSGFAINDKIFRGVDFFTETVKKIGMDKSRASRSIGTLGGGNHFIEAGYGSDGKLWVTIHSGSRNFGLQIAKYHGAKAKELCAKWGADTQGIPFLIVDSPEGRDYIADQLIGSKYASINRETMMDKLEKFFGVSPIDSIESRHNFIDDIGMIRKGATPAHEGQRVIIPFNKRDGLARCKGGGNKEYNCSAPHGAGRILSRSKAKELLDVEYFQEGMKQAGVYTTTANESTIDESPEAYKDMSLILENIKDTVDVIEMIRPVYNFKAGKEG